jgi:hypothetical protein
MLLSWLYLPFEAEGAGNVKGKVESKAIPVTGHVDAPALFRQSAHRLQ